MDATLDSIMGDTAQVWHWLREVPDPEIPVISVVDLGIVRDVAFDDAHGTCVVTITPTYSGCPAMAAIEEDIVRVLRMRGLGRVRVERRLAPAWTTDWMSETGRAALRHYGIAPPGHAAGGHVVDTSAVGRARRVSHEQPVACPQCGSLHTRLVSQFGSTSCKALYACRDCREPFDHFKAH